MGSQGSSNASAVVTGVPVGEPSVASARPPVAQQPNVPSKANALDLVFTMDCTGSMGSYIQSAKQNIELIVRRLADAEGYDLRFGLVAYRDHPPQDQSYVTRSYAFTTEVSTMQSNLKQLSAQGGGDGPEAVAAALKATHDMAWREDAAKIVILIADAPPHGLGESGDGFPDGGPDGVDPLVMLDQMSARGITIYSCGCEPALSNYRFAVDFFTACAERTNGQAVSLSSAASLADVIMGGAIEEMDLQKLGDAMANDVQQLMRSAPDMCEAEVQQSVCSAWQAKGQKTRQMKTSKLKSAYGDMVCAAPTLSAAKMSLASAAPPPCPPGSFGRGGGRRTMKKKSSGLGLMRCSAASPLSSDAFEDEDIDEMGAVYRGGHVADVSIEEEAISMEQVSRLYKSCQKKGVF